MMSKRNQLLFIFLHIIAWIIFVGLCIEAGGYIVNFFFSLFKPEIVHNLYQKLDLSDLYNRSKLAFFCMYGFILVVSIAKAYLFYVVIMLALKFNLAKPFSSFVSKQITLISYCTLFIGVLSLIARQTTEKLLQLGYEIDALKQFWADSKAFILMAAVIYIIAAIFKKGVEIQNENDLTI